jgi:hypothetical protein
MAQRDGVIVPAALRDGRLLTAQQRRDPRCLPKKE